MEQSWCPCSWKSTWSVKNKAAKWVFEALEHVTAVSPFPIITMNATLKQIKLAALLRQFLELTGQPGILSQAKKAPEANRPS